MMLELPRRLKGLFRHEREGKVVLSNLETGLILQASPMLQEFLSICERLNTDEVEQHLKSRYPDRSVDHFLRRVELYSTQLFVSESPAVPKNRVFSLANWKAQDFRPFTSLTLNLVHSCNLRCDYCFESIEFRRDTSSMSSEVAAKATRLFLEQLRGESGHLIFTGGEPLLRPKVILEVVRQVEQSGVPVSFMIKTNATLLSPEIRQQLVAANFRFQVSLDGPEAVHNHHRKDGRGQGSYAATMAGLQGLLADVPGDRIQLHGTVTHQTVGNTWDSLQFLHSLGTYSVALKPVMSRAHDIALDDADEDTYARQVFRNVRRMAGARSSRDSEVFSGRDGVCGIGLWHIAVDVDGSIYPCYRLSGHTEYRMGHIDQGLVGVIPDQLLRMYDWEDPEGCGHCTRRVFCSRGCYSERLLTPSETPCDRWERAVTERMIGLNFQQEEVIAMLPVL